MEIADMIEHHGHSSQGRIQAGQTLEEMCLGVYAARHVMV